jgi:mRNA interferase RelE/StbE
VPDTPPIRFVRTNRFLRAYRKLDERYRELIKRALIQFVADRTNPSLRIKRIRGTERIWEMRAGRDIRITFEFQDSGDEITTIVLRNVGHHDQILKSP